jgi:hypothetical protein
MPLVDFFIERYNRNFKKSVRGITDDTRRLILSHNWPGNVRELKNAIERGMILEDEPFLRPYICLFLWANRAAALSLNELRPRTAGRPCSTAAPCHGFISRKAGPLWRKWSTPWSSWRCAKRMGTRPTPPSFWISAATHCVTS